MNKEIILSMAKPYVKDGAITYDEFDQLFSILSRKEQYTVSELLFNNGINLVDSHVAEDALVLDAEVDDDILSEDFPEEDFEVLYDEDIFRDKTSGSTHLEELVLNKNLYEGDFTNEDRWNLLENYFLGIIPEKVKHDCKQERPDIIFD